MSILAVSLAVIADRSVTRTATVFVLMAALGASASAAFVPPNPARIAEIAAYLPEKPAPAHPDGIDRWRAPSAKLARQLRDTPIPAFDLAAYNEFWETGNRTHFKKWRDGFLGPLRALAAKELEEKKGRFLPTIAERLEHVCTWPSWTLNAHDRQRDAIDRKGPVVGLTSSGLAHELAQILVALGDRLPTGTVARVRREIDVRVLEPYLDVAARTSLKEKLGPSFSWFFGRNNWNAVCHCNCVCTALALVSDRETRAKFVEAAERAIPSYLNGFTADGYCSEGMGYWNYGFGHFLAMGLAVRTATGGKVDFFAEPKTKVCMRYPFAYQLQKGLSPRFADGGGNPAQHCLEWGYSIWPDLRAEGEGALPLRGTFPEGQVWIFRTPTGEGKPFAIACKGGYNNECHNHNDLGSYTLMLDGTFVTGDPGGEVYTRRTFSKQRYESKVLSSYGHPVPRVGGQLQPAGAKYAARVLESAFSDDVDVVTLELKRAYDCPSLVSLTRTFRLDRATRTVEIADRVKFSAPTEFEDPVISEELPGQLQPAVRVTGGAWSWQEDRIENPDRPTLLRRAVTFDGPITEAEVVFSFRDELSSASDLPQEKE